MRPSRRSRERAHPNRDTWGWDSRWSNHRCHLRQGLCHVVLLLRFLQCQGHRIPCTIVVPHSSVIELALSSTKRDPKGRWLRRPASCIPPPRGPVRPRHKLGLPNDSDIDSLNNASSEAGHYRVIQRCHPEDVEERGRSLKSRAPSWPNRRKESPSPELGSVPGSNGTTASAWVQPSWAFSFPEQPPDDRTLRSI